MNPGGTEGLGECCRRMVEQVDLEAMVTQINEAAGLSAAEASANGAYLLHRKSSLLELVELLSEDEEELYDSLAMHWLELRLEWARYNQLMQYSMVLSGTATPSLMARGAACAGSLSWFEGLLAPQDLEGLQAIAALPLSVRRDRDQLAERVVHQELHRADQLEEALLLTADLKQTLADWLRQATPLDRQRLERLAQRVRGSHSAILQAREIEFCLVSPHLERLLLEGLWSRGKTVTVVVRGPDKLQAARLQPLLSMTAQLVEESRQRVANDGCLTAQLEVLGSGLELVLNGSAQITLKRASA